VRILIVTPAPRGSRLGNWVSANRWARLMRSLGHRVTVAQSYSGQACDILIALHAVGSARAMHSLRRERPNVPVILVLTGTDLYRDLPRRRTRARVEASLAIADRIVTLNRDAVHWIPAKFRKRVRCILQASEAISRHALPIKRSKGFLVAVAGHLRREKDPLRAAYAVRTVPTDSRLTIEHAGRALDARWKTKAVREMRINPRYLWLGEISAAGVARLLARSKVLVHPSRMEGGANVLVEAVSVGLPIIASRVSGNVGVLGADYPGLFPVGNTRALRTLLLRAEGEPAFMRALTHATRRLKVRLSPNAEREGWRQVLKELSSHDPVSH
jgi:putative glycosyltransferase (TIGR04348 family)